MEEAFKYQNIEKKAAENIWLVYFNNYLFEHRIISKEEYSKIIDKISKNNHK